MPNVHHLESLALIIALLYPFTASAMMFPRKTTDNHRETRPNTTKTSASKPKPNITLIIILIVVVLMILVVLFVIWPQWFIQKMREKRKIMPSSKIESKPECLSGGGGNRVPDNMHRMCRMLIGWGNFMFFFVIPICMIVRPLFI